MSDIRAMLSSDRMDWETPPELFAWISEKYGPFDLDAAATAENALCATYFTPEDDGLAQSWEGCGSVWLNPPYGREIGKWVKKAADEFFSGNVNKVVMLIPARTDTAYWHDHIQNIASVEFIRGRVKFLLNGEPKGTAPFPSAIVVYER